MRSFIPECIGHYVNSERRPALLLEATRVERARGTTAARAAWRALSYRCKQADDDELNVARR